MTFTPEVEEFLGRLDPDVRDELMAHLHPDVVTQLGALDDPVLAARLAAGTEAFNMLVETLKHSVDGIGERLDRQEKECFLSTAVDREAVIRAARIIVPE